MTTEIDEIADALTIDLSVEATEQTIVEMTPMTKSGPAAQVLNVYQIKPELKPK
jgi:hypothetical protein